MKTKKKALKKVLGNRFVKICLIFIEKGDFYLVSAFFHLKKVAWVFK
jgi:hypothetical protein